ncbi:hypothetical protein [Tepidibacter mesophilus]|uniref:hypothetical protein n=1 Tax=Tepidibacter mesophilus TaxID=655607 RepID=UPI000C075E7C|nr:hypothetical protein [Tepidibacter mesophilus]
MINLNFDDRLNLLNLSNKVVVSSDEFIIEEKEKSGKSKLKCKVSDYTVAFLNADKYIFEYLKDRKCADAIILQRNDKGLWKVKIIEFKKTINIRTLSKSLKQFKGAVSNVLAISGLLGIESFENIEFYSAFREEKISNIKNENSVILKNVENMRLIKQWEDGIVKFDFLNSNAVYGKIYLNDNGDGEILF